MASKSRVIWTLKELTLLLRERQLNQFDVNIGISGNRGNGKSTLAFKIFNSYKTLGFRQKTHQVYSQKDVINLLSRFKFSYCWDDEAINSGYKRDFQHTGQKDLIKIVTNYRDNYNVYASALPFFYSLDKALRELIFIHFHIIKRGLAVILLPLDNQIHSQDPWDTKTNQKIEEKENKRLEKNPDAKFRYHRLTTFAGFVYFGDMSAKQRLTYEAIKQKKRAASLNIITEEKEKTFVESAYGMLLERKFTTDGLLQACAVAGKKYSTVLSELNKKLKNNMKEGTVNSYLRKSLKDKAVEVLEEESRSQLNSLVPKF
ncbi:hypothetical protein LCGC14_2232720 [marine sediment metagenome]|uniref:Zona occludens toxin N-terminal domain-containing protein n=1 Tax=marine sediment metagenome TaxID=412755 RepID=A0A0F9FK89_9ZZZZ